jgi:hypothetical protein
MLFQQLSRVELLRCQTKMKILLITLALFFTAGNARSNPMQGFPLEFKVSSLWEQLVIDGKPTQAYRFVASEPVDDVTRKITQWLTQAQSLPQRQTKNGWVYISHRKGSTWTSVQLRSFGNQSTSVEGIVSFWRESIDSTNDFDSRIKTLRNMKVIRRLESIDKGRRAITLTAIGDGSIGSISESLAGDLKRLGFAPASFAPPSMRGLSNSRVGYEAVSQAWTGNGRQVVFVVFEHRGKTAAQIYVLGGKSANE